MRAVERQLPIGVGHATRTSGSSKTDALSPPPIGEKAYSSETDQHHRPSWWKGSRAYGRECECADAEAARGGELAERIARRCRALREKAENICALTVGKSERNTLGVYRSRSGWKQQIVAPEKRGQPVIVLPPIVLVIPVTASPFEPTVAVIVPLPGSGTPPRLAAGPVSVQSNVTVVASAGSRPFPDCSCGCVCANGWCPACVASPLSRFVPVVLMRGVSDRDLRLQRRHHNNSRTAGNQSEHQGAEDKEFSHNNPHIVGLFMPKDSSGACDCDHWNVEGATPPRSRRRAVDRIKLPRAKVHRTVNGSLSSNLSASRFTAGANGFLILSQWSDRPARYGDPSRFDTMPSQLRAQACL